MQNAAKAMVELLLFCAGSQRFTLSGERVNPRSVPVTQEPESDKLKTQRRAKLLTAGRGCLSLFKAPPFAKKRYIIYATQIILKKPQPFTLRGLFRITSVNFHGLENM